MRSSTITLKFINNNTHALKQITKDAQQDLYWRSTTITMTLINCYNDAQQQLHWAQKMSSSIITSTLNLHWRPATIKLTILIFVETTIYLKENKFLSQSLFRTKFCCTWLAQDDSSFALQKSRQNSNNLFKCLKVNAHIETMLCRFPFVPCTPRWAWLHFNCTCSMWLNIIWIHETITVISS